MTFRKNRKTHRTFWSPAARKWVDNKTEYLIEEEDKSPSQAYAIAISMARKKGYKISKRKVVKRKRDSGYVPFGSVASEISKRAAP